MANIVYGTNARPSGAAPTNPRPRAKAWMQKPQGGGKFLVQIPGVRGGMVMDEIDACITYGGRGLFGPDHQIIDRNSKTTLSSTSKLGAFLLLSTRYILTEFLAKSIRGGGGGCCSWFLK